MSKLKVHSGIMEYWKDGIMVKSEGTFYINPIFQRSVIPFLHALFLFDIELSYLELIHCQNIIDTETPFFSKRSFNSIPTR
jgi:hypothetical protein